MGSIVGSTGYKVLHRPVEPAGIIGMGESERLGRPRFQVLEIFVFAQDH
jgi:hypothetical protein